MTLITLWPIMIQNNIRHLPIVEDSGLVGLAFYA